ncbi:MAG: hypothetical protein IJW86_05755 [Clostridia bacterium]|nr:hypothetical protein [Clostridia bacterium]
MKENLSPEAKDNNTKKNKKTKREPKFKEKMNVSLKSLPMLFFCAGLVCVVLRTLQTAKYIDPETGFYLGGEAVKAVIYAVLLLSGIIFCLMSFFSRESASLSFYKTKNKAMGFAAAAMGFTFIFDSADNFFSTFGSAAQINSANYTEFMTSGTIPMLIQSFFALLSAVYFFILAKDMLKGTASASKRYFLATAPVWWAGARLMHRFVRQISFVEVSDLFLELIEIALMLVFFMSLAQVVTGVYSDGFRWRIFGLGYSASLLALTMSIPRLIFSFVKDGAFINPSHPFYLCDLMFAIFALTVILCHKKEKEDMVSQSAAVPEIKAE